MFQHDLAASVPTPPMPIVVDLDGTLIRTDLLVEGLCQLAGRSLPTAARLLWAHWRRPERLKAEVFRLVDIDVATLPYNEPLLDWLRGEAREGRDLYLASASPRFMVERIAAHLGIFAGAMGSDEARNLKAAAKLSAIREEVGPGPFAYVGDSAADLAIWAEASQVVTVNAGAAASRGLARLAASRDAASPHQAGLAFDYPGADPRQLLKGMRPHQWVKNVLVFLPVLAGHRWGDPGVVGLSLLAFLAFSMCASAVYLINDLVDIEDDRHHRDKRRRPIASGALRPGVAVGAAAALMSAALLIALWLAPPLVLPLLAYVAATFAYSFRIKAMEGLDVIWLAGLYTVRVIGGAAATGIVTSSWLLTFCVFIFLSLACAKRCAEMMVHLASEREMSSRRGYRVSDLDVMSGIGLASGFSAVIVLMIYLQSDATLELYGRPKVLILIGVVLMYWLCRLWLKVRRNELHSDPIVFALTDRSSQAAGLLTAMAFILATYP